MTEMSDILKKKASVTTFNAAVRKIEKMTAEIAAGKVDRADEMKVFRQIDKLDDIVYKSWAYHDDAARRDAEYAVGSALRKKASEATEKGADARIARNNAEILAIKHADRDKIANMTWDERARHRYQQEIKLMSGR